MHETLDQLFASARRLVHSWKPGRNGRRAFEDFVTTNLAAQHDLLGVQICGYLFANPLQGIPVLAFGEGRYPYSFPYWWSDKERMARFEPLVADAFIVWRTEVYSDEPEVPPGRYPSEVTSFLPHPDIAPLNTVARVEKKIREELYCHYCPVGEVLFFLAAWRLLFRLCSSHGAAIPMSRGAEAIRQAGCEFLWNSGKSTEVRTPEYRWVGSMHARPSAGLWTELAERVDRSQRWRDDLMVLGLDTSRKAGGVNGLAACLRYIGTALSGRVEAEDARATVADIERKLEDGSATITDVETTLLKGTASVFALNGSSDDPPVGELLEVLHVVARFPLVPYFYWYAIDPRPRAHIVIPVLRAPSSQRRTLVYAHPARSREECLRFSNRRMLDMSIVGAAVLGIEPAGTFDWTLQASDCTDLRPLENLQRYVELLAQIPADEVYHGQVNRQVFAMQQASFLGHEVLDPVLQIKNRLYIIADQLPQSRGLLKSRVFEHLLGYCYAELKNFRVLAGSVKWLPQTVRVSELIRVIGVILGDEECNEDRFPLGATELRSARNPQSPPDIHVIAKCDAHCVWHIDLYKVVAIVVSLAKNAARATRVAGRSQSAVLVCLCAVGHDAQIDVEDKGVGIEASLHKRIFDIDYTTKADGAGRSESGGLGLFIARAFAHAGGGSCIVHWSEPGQGSRFRVTLPGAIKRSEGDGTEGVIL